MSYNIKLGIMGGTFNPIHNGHLHIAKHCLDAMKLDKVLFVPSGISYMKDQSGIVSPEHRYAMTLAAIEDTDVFEISDIEVRRGGNSYTCVTLEKLSKIYPDSRLYFICGADTFFNIESWYKPELIFRHADILCCPRPGNDNSKLKQTAAYLTERYNARAHLLECDYLDISSTDIRELIRQGLPTDDLLPRKAAEYIRANNLYTAQG